MEENRNAKNVVRTGGPLNEHRHVWAQTGNSQPDVDMILDRHTTTPNLCRGSNVESVLLGRPDMLVVPS
jgi:hypothetical protein